MKKLIWLVVIILILGGMSVFLLKGKTKEIVITQKQIEEKLSEKFPYEKNYLLILKLTYSNPQLEFLAEDNKIRVGLDATLNLRMGGLPQKN